MSLPPMPGAHDEVDDRYRRASALDPSRPGEAVRRRVLEHAAQLVAERTGSQPSVSVRGAAVRRRRSFRRPAALFGTLAAAAIAGIMIAPRFVMPPVAPSSRTTSTPVEALREPKLSQRPAPASAPALEMAPPPKEAQAVAGTAADARAAANAPSTAKAANAGKVASAAKAASAADVVSGNVTEQQVVVTAARRAAMAPQAAMIPPAPAAKVTDSASALRHAAETGDLRTLDRMLAMQPDINAPDAAGRTPLMLAILRGQTEIVSALLAYGADPNAADSHGTTPLQAARARGHPAIIAALQRYGAR